MSATSTRQAHRLRAARTDNGRQGEIGGFIAPCAPDLLAITTMVIVSQIAGNAGSGPHTRMDGHGLCFI
ncbi:MAG TPA: hypothetical protein PKC22_14505 [Rhodocyclaceae bacterium]|nr:hypothetical protein [Rhodocyclaceae bacterium]